VTLLVLVGVGLPASLVLKGPAPDRTRYWEIAADRFVAGIALGSGTDDEGRTGFASAYDLLTESRRETLPFDVFFEEWSRLFDERGFVVDRVRDGNHQARGRSGDPICYLLFLGGEQQDHSKLSTIRLEITLLRNGTRYTVSSYKLRDVPNPRATR
jgi:hypothetical protein